MTELHIIKDSIAVSSHNESVPRIIFFIAVPIEEFVGPEVANDN